MYEDLVCRLNEQAGFLEFTRRYKETGNTDAELHKEAANAITKLSRYLCIANANTDYFSDRLTEARAELFSWKDARKGSHQPLPNDGDTVLIFAQCKNKPARMDVASFHLIGGTSDYMWNRIETNFWYSSDEVTHWKQLPIAPQDG